MMGVTRMYIMEAGGLPSTITIAFHTLENSSASIPYVASDPDELHQQSHTHERATSHCP